MPWPGTSIPAPWDPAPTAAPPDTSQRDKLVATLGAQHGGLVGTPSTPTVKNPKDPSGGEIAGPYDLYSFADGSTLEIAPTGEVSKYTPKTTTGTVAGWTDITQVRNPDQTITYYGKDPKDPGGPLKPVEGLPTSAAPTSTAQTATPSADLDKLDARGNVIPPGDTTTKPVFTRDPKTGTTTQLKDQPTATSQLDRMDAQGKVIPPGDTTTKAVSLRDPVTGTVIDVPKDAAGSVTAVGDTMYVIKPDGSSTPVVGPDGKPLTKPKDASQFNVPGVGLVNYDPSSGKANVLIAAPTGVQAKDLKPEVRGGKTYIPVDNGSGGIAWQEAKDENGKPLPTDQVWTAVSNDPRSSQIQLISSTGETKSIPKEDFHPPPNPQAGQAVTPDTTAPYLVTIGDDGKPVFTPNQNQLSITDATRQMIDSLGVHLAAGSMSESQAQDLIKNLTSQMTAQAAVQNAQANALNAQGNILQGATTAAGNIVSGATQGATAGANLLTQRAQTAQNMIGSTLGILGHTQKGLLTPLPSDFGANLTGGAAAYATQLMGGDDVATAAANLVKAADPNNQSGIASQGYAVLQQMLQKYKDLTGTLHPLGAQANAQAGAQANTGFNAPLTNVTPNPSLSAANQPNQFGFNPQASTAALNAAGFMDTPEGRQSAIAAGQGSLLGVAPPPQPQPVPNPTPVPAPGSPYLSYANQIPGANYGSSVYVPGVGFVAPNTMTVSPASAPVPQAVRVTANGVV